MSRPAALLAVALAVLLAPGDGAPLRRQGSRHKLLLVSFDGFRWDYDQDVDTPHLDAMARDGVKARYMTPPFVTMTSPCHFTLVTGEGRLRMGLGPAGAEEPGWGAGYAHNPVPGHRVGTQGSQQGRHSPQRWRQLIAKKRGQGSLAMVTTARAAAQEAFPEEVSVAGTQR